MSAIGRVRRSCCAGSSASSTAAMTRPAWPCQDDRRIETRARGREPSRAGGPSATRALASPALATADGSTARWPSPRPASATPGGPLTAASPRPTRIPHADTDGRVRIVLNGIIENHLELRERAGRGRREFTSETDAEVVAHLIAHHYEGDLARRGAAALAAAAADTTRSSRCAPTSPTCWSAPAASARSWSGWARVGTSSRRRSRRSCAHTRTVSMCWATARSWCSRPTEAELSSIVDGSAAAPCAHTVDWDEDVAREGRLRDVHAQGDPRAGLAARGHARGMARPRRLALAGRAASLDERSCAGISRVIIVACGTSYHAGLRGRIRARALGAHSGRGRGRLGVPLPRSAARPRMLVHRHHTVGRDRRHARGDAPRARPAAPRSWRSRTCSAARPHAKPTACCSPAPASRSGSPRPRPSSPRCVALYAFALRLGRAARHAHRGPAGELDRRAGDCCPARIDAVVTSVGRRGAAARRAPRELQPVLPLPRPAPACRSRSRAR